MANVYLKIAHLKMKGYKGVITLKKKSIFANKNVPWRFVGFTSEIKAMLKQSLDGKCETVWRERMFVCGSLCR